MVIILAAIFLILFATLVSIIIAGVFEAHRSHVRTSEIPDWLYHCALVRDEECDEVGR